MANNVNLFSLILLLRNDLRQLGYNEQESKDAFFFWLITSGLKEYPALLSYLPLRALMNLNGFGPRKDLSYVQWLIWNYRPDLQNAFPLPENLKTYLNWFDVHAVKEYVFSKLMNGDIKGNTDICRQPKDTFGVNLIGYVYGELGIGEDVRMAGRALIMADIPMTLLNFNPGNDIPRNDQSMAQFVSDEGPYAINIACMPALEHGRHYLEFGQRGYEGRYNIGYWPWELSQWPKEWEMMFSLVDEVWVSTWHIYRALADICPKPLMYMPTAVELPEIMHFQNKDGARAHFNLPRLATLFCFSFDLNSSVDRKNPQACIDAFLQAFPAEKYSSEDVGLIIKVHQPTRLDVDWEILKSLSEKDSRIHIIEETFQKSELLALYKACDCFLSLHRAEGFGRSIAEALQLGLHVITTGYSGNLDFCKLPNAALVDYKLIPVEKGQYPFGEGQVWADPDIQHAAKLMDQFYSRTPTLPSRADWSEFSSAAVGERYKKRLEEIRREKPHFFDIDL